MPCLSLYRRRAFIYNSHNSSSSEVSRNSSITDTSKSSSRREKSSIITSSRPIEDSFSRPKRRFTFPGVDGSLSKRFSTSTAGGASLTRRHTTDGVMAPRVSTRESRKGHDNESAFESFYRSVRSEVLHHTVGKKDKWIACSWCKPLLTRRDLDLKATLAELKHKYPGWSNDTISLECFIINSAPRLFAMLVYTRTEELLDKFCTNDIGDAMFPIPLTHVTLAQEHLTITEPSPVTLPLGETDFESVEVLLELRQKKFFAPKLCWPKFEPPPFTGILPFLAEPEEIHSSSFSVVSKCLIHRDYIEVDSKGLGVAVDYEGNPYVAVKKLLPLGLDPADFAVFIKEEYETLDRLRSLTSKHLIKASAFYNENGSRYFVFPWAQHGNLSKFWNEKIPSSHDNKYLEWVIEQFIGLATAMRSLHHQDDGKSCRHNDLKPENILCFTSAGCENSSDHTSCVLVITDVGIARTHSEATAMREKTRLQGGETRRYRAPETELFPDAPTSRRYDMWSLGCIYLEFVIWLLFDPDALLQFSQDVNGNFYKIVPSDFLHPERKDTAKISDQVEYWINKVRTDPRCASKGSKETAFGRLITFIEKRLLVTITKPGISSAPNKLKIQDQASIDSSDEALDPSFFNVRAATVIGDDFSSAKPKSHFDGERGAYSTENERASAAELCRELISIARDVKDNSIYWLNSVDIPVQSGTHSEKGQKLDVDDKWNYIPDLIAAERLRPILEQSSPDIETSELCERCLTLKIWSPDCEFYDTAARLNDKAEHCALCRLLARSLSDRITLSHEPLKLFRFGSSIKCNNKQLAPSVALYILPVSNPEVIYKTGIQLGFPKLSDSGGPAHLDVIREWIKDCDTHQCLRSDDEPFLPTRLLDVGRTKSKRSRLICNTKNLTKTERYLALSHRWGVGIEGNMIVNTYNSNIEKLKAGIDDFELPPKYKDAIFIARELKIQYLWIDSLCIVQQDKTDPNDKGEDWKEESQHMEQVFRSAYATIAASCAASSAEHFLKARPERQCVRMLNGNTAYYLCDPIDNFYADVEDGELNKRGWVFQERALSRRTIFFTEKQTYWECGEGVRCETLTKMTSSSASSLLGDANFPYSSGPFEDGTMIKLWQNLYERYTTLTLSYITDRPVAIRGLETRLLRALGTDGGYGVLARHLREGLLWKRKFDQLERIPFTKEEGDNTVSEPVPSWSWMAYAGQIEYLKLSVDWDERELDITSPWKHGNYDRSGGHDALELFARAREMTSLPPGAQVFIDDPLRPFGNPLKCVVVGSSTTSSHSASQKYFVLIVAPLSTRASNAYERIGVAVLRHSQIAWTIPVTEVRIR